MPARKRPLSLSSMNDQVRPDPCDYQLIACSNCLQLLACVVDIVAMFDERATELANLIDCAADCFTCSVAGCMGAQIKHEMDKDQHGIVYAVAVPTPMSVAQAHGARLPLPSSPPPSPPIDAHTGGAPSLGNETKLRRSLVGKRHNAAQPPSESASPSRCFFTCPPLALPLARLSPAGRRRAANHQDNSAMCVSALGIPVVAVGSESAPPPAPLMPSPPKGTEPPRCRGRVRRPHRRMCVRRRQELARGGSAAGS